MRKIAQEQGCFWPMQFQYHLQNANAISDTESFQCVCFFFYLFVFLKLWVLVIKNQLTKAGLLLRSSPVYLKSQYAAI